MNKIVVDSVTGIVENKIVADFDFKIEGKSILVDDGRAEIGDIYDGEKFIKPSPPPVDKLTARQAALAAKWPDAFALWDDVFKRGIDAVKVERDAIKAAHPKE